MSELEQVLVGDSAHTPPANILENLASDMAHRAVPGAPHTIYEELWHIAFWQQVTLDWVRGVETPVPDHASAGFPAQSDAEIEDWDRLRRRFFSTSQEAVAVARDASRLDAEVPAHRGRECRFA